MSPTTGVRKKTPSRATPYREKGHCVTNKDGALLCDERTARDEADSETMKERRFSLGSLRCRCGGCGRHFGGVRAFDLHQRLTSDGDALCIYPGTIGLTVVTDPRGAWWVRQYEKRGEE